jgi:hypothetical protein
MLFDETKCCKLFDDNKSYKYRHLELSGLIRDRADLETKKTFGFPSGRLYTPRDRQWTGKELNAYIASRPTTQAEFNAMKNRPPTTKPDIPKRKRETA